MAVAEILRLETVFTWLKKWFNKLETLVHQVETKTVAVFKPKQNNKKQKQRLRLY
jgi:hypothetical protein